MSSVVFRTSPEDNKKSLVSSIPPCQSLDLDIPFIEFKAYSLDTTFMLYNRRIIKTDVNTLTVATDLMYWRILTSSVIM